MACGSALSRPILPSRRHILAPNLQEVASRVLGWPLLAVIPDRDFLYLWAAQRGISRAASGGWWSGSSRARPPITTEVFEIGDDGIRAIGAFLTAETTEDEDL